jgi:hypothetical protein
MIKIKLNKIISVVKILVLKKLFLHKNICVPDSCFT